MKQAYELELDCGDVYCQIRSGDMSEDEFNKWVDVVCSDIHNNGGIHTIFKVVKTYGCDE